MPTILPPGSAGLCPPRGPGWLLSGKSMSQELHGHQGLEAMERCWRLRGDRARVGFGRPVRPLPLLGSRLAVPPQSLSQR
ncbi:MAG: hypothetical protein ACK41W_06950 [Cyanobacteriota bacterium]